MEIKTKCELIGMMNTTPSDSIVEHGIWKRINSNKNSPSKSSFLKGKIKCS
jgi:hypothetical protein